MGEARERVILHADMDAFFASIEQRDNPELRGKPVIVGAVSRRGVVAAASYEARVFGVRSAMPGFRARELCPHGVYLPSDIEKYGRVSAEVHRVFAELTPVIEPIALDEAFLDVTASVHLFGGAEALGRHLKARVREVTGGLAVSCGIARSKLVAKIACALGKPDGLKIVRADEERALLDPLPIRRLWGVGPVAEAQLQEAGFRTFADLANADPRRLRAVLGNGAEELQKRARGDDTRPVEADRDAKSYGEESTFERDVSARDEVTAAITGHAEAVARRLRHDALAGKTVTLKIKLGRARKERVSRSAAGESEPSYPLLSRSKTLAQATDDAAVIRKAAIALWDAAAVGEPVRLLGVSLSHLEPGGKQLELFGDRKAGKLGAAMDAIATRFGRDKIGRAIDAPQKATPSMRKKRGED